MASEIFDDKHGVENHVENSTERGHEHEAEPGYFLRPIFLGSLCAIGLALFSVRWAVDHTHTPRLILRPKGHSGIFSSCPNLGHHQC